MRLSQMYMKTLREVPNEAEIPSHVLLLRTGMIRKLASGVYGFLPLGWRSLRKIEEIIRQEMDRAGARSPAAGTPTGLSSGASRTATAETSAWGLPTKRSSPTSSGTASPPTGSCL